MSVIRSERKNRGIPPERYGEEKKNGDLPENGIETTLSSTSERLCNESINGITTVDVHVPMNSLKSYEGKMKTGTTEVSSKMSRNTMRRRQLEIDLEAEKRIIELERRLILKEAQLKKVKLEEEYGSRAEESSRNDNSNRKREDIQKWINGVENSIDDITVLSFRSGKGADHEIATDEGDKKKKYLCVTTEGKQEKCELYCSFCKKTNHKIDKCTFFQQLDMNKRWEWVTQNKVCFTCLGSRHQARYCHLPNETRADISEVEVVHHHMKEEENKVLLRVAPVVINGPKVDMKLAEKLGATGPREPLTLRWTNSVINKEYNSQRIHFEIRGENETENHWINNARTVSNLNLPSQTINSKIWVKMEIFIFGKCFIDSNANMKK
ncbi:hypothetical protein JTB14_004992 [Gonioctena quinquepunctata]|nr:hypothetical protein JTB14_004992 [Gonioctena quinquepunctata]